MFSISLSVLFFNSTFATIGCPAKGTIHMAYVDYYDSNTITITAGYGECNQHTWEIQTPIQHDMTGLASTEDFHYIYIDDFDSNYPDVVIRDSTVEPEWSDSKLGWYDVNDRCIGTIWCSGAYTIPIFTNNSLNKYGNYSDYIKQVLTNGNPNGTFQEVDASAYIPVNAIAVWVRALNKDTDGTVQVRITPYENCTMNLTQNSNSGEATAAGWLELPRRASGKLYWFGDDNDDNLFSVRICGFQIER